MSSSRHSYSILLTRENALRLTKRSGKKCLPVSVFWLLVEQKSICVLHLTFEKCGIVWEIEMNFREKKSKKNCLKDMSSALALVRWLCTFHNGYCPCAKCPMRNCSENFFSLILFLKRNKAKSYVSFSWSYSWNGIVQKTKH